MSPAPFGRSIIGTMERAVSMFMHRVARILAGNPRLGIARPICAACAVLDSGLRVAAVPGSSIHGQS